MLRLIVYSAVGASILAAMPHYASQFQEHLAERQAQEAAAFAEQARRATGDLGKDTTPTTYTASYAVGRSIRLAADPQGHFTGDFRINGREMQGLVDTGATYVALNRSTARMLGVTPTSDDYNMKISTANGNTLAAKVTLDRVEIGPIRVEDVEAFVLDDSNLSVTLIGMSFMKELEGYRVENDELLLID